MTAGPTRFTGRPPPLPPFHETAGGRGQRGLVEAPAGGLTGRPPSQEEGGVAGGRGGWEKLRLMQGVEGVELEVGRGGPRHTEINMINSKNEYLDNKLS